MATITFNQAGLSPAGITNRSRSDGLANGAKVSIALDEAGTVIFVDVPEGDVNSVASLVSEGPLLWSFTPTAGIYGSWLVELQPLAASSPVRRVFAVRTPEKGLRIPAFNEHAASSATVETGESFVDASDDNEGGSYRGWARALAELFRTVANGLFTANKVQESGGPATLNVSTIPASGMLRRNSSSQIVGGPVLVDNAGNITGAGTYNGVSVTAHAARHVDGGADEISVTGLSGLLADPQTAGGIKTATTVVNVSTAAAPTVGQALIASSSTAAAWTTPPLTALSDAVPVQLGPNTVGAAGISTNAARDDHAHAIFATATPTALTIGNAAVTGTSGHAARGDHQHGMPGLATTSFDGFMPATAVTKLSGIAAGADVTLTALSTAAVDIAVNSHKITGLADPTNAQDAVTKAYADAVTQGLDVKQSCRVIATGNVTLSGTQTVDGVAVQAGNRVLCTGQTTGSTNGIYVAAAGAWTRAPDADTSADVSSGMFTFVVEGTGNADSGWVLITVDPIVLGTTPLVFTQFSGAGQIQAGDGLTKAGNTLNVGANADGSIVVAADDVRVGVLSTDAQHGVRGGGTQHAVATTLAAGFMAPADRIKLDALTEGGGGGETVVAGGGLTKIGATLDVVAADASIVVNPDSIGVGVLQTDPQHGTRGGGTQHAVVTTSVDGFMAAADKVKLDGVAAGAAALTVAGTPTQISVVTAAVGSGTVAARNDHLHSVATATPIALTVGGASTAGTATTLVRSDHTHGIPSFGTTAGTFCEGNDPRLSGGGGGVSASFTNMPFTLRKVSTGALVAEEIGVLRFDASRYAGSTITLVAEMDVSTPGQIATLQMISLNDSSVVTTLTTSAMITTKCSAEVTLPASEVLYGVRLSRTGGTEQDFVSCHAVGLEVVPNG